MRRWLRDTPWWVPAIILTFGVSEPLAHLWLVHGLPEGIVHTGFRIGDTPFFLAAMRGFHPEFVSPYLPCAMELPPGLFALLALPHHWLYATLGYFADTVGMPHFHALGVANGLAGMYFLLAVWGFLRTVAPTRARMAFLFFTLGGGVAGLLYVGVWAFGAAEGAGFEGWFHRYARYELIEGPFLAPLLVFPRLYYTLALGWAFVALTAVARRMRLGGLVQGPQMHRDLGAFLYATCLNARVGLLVLPLVCAFCLFGRTAVLPRILWVVIYVGQIAFTTLIVTVMFFSINESGAENVDALLRRSVWFGSLLGATVLLLPLAGVSVWAQGRGLAWPLRGLLGAGCGYLVAFAGLYFAHQVYWGNLWSGGDAAAAVAVSDWALVGAALGGVVSGRWSVVSSQRSVAGRRASGDRVMQAMALWLVFLLAVGVSAWGGGWFLRFMPERALALCGVPLALLAADGWHRLQVWSRLRGRGGRWVAWWPRVVVGAGVVSNAVAYLCFQGPLGQRPGEGAFAWTHSEMVWAEDAHLMDAIDGGTVLAPASPPPLLGDVVVHRRPGTRTVLGQPTLEFAGVNMLTRIQEVQAFFDPASLGTDYDHRAVAEAWCVDYVLCPQTHPVDARVLAYFRAQPWLAEVLGERDIALFRVVREVAP